MNETHCIKVCFVAPKAYPLFNPEIQAVFGGAEVDIYMIARELAKDGRFQVSCITADYGQKPVEIIHNVKIIKSLNFKSNIISQTIKLWKTLNTTDAQIFFQETASPGTFLIAFHACLKKKVFIYRTAHKDECDGAYIKKYLIRGRLFKWALHHAHKVFTQNKSDVTDIQNTLGISSSALPNAHELVETNFDNRRTILWIGRSASFKQPEKFLRLANEFPHEHFTIICPRAIGDKTHDYLRQQAANTKNCEFIDYVPFHQIHQYFRSAKIFVNTSDAEGFPNTFIQAGISAVPILSLNVNPDNFINRFQCGKCANGKWNDLVEGVHFMLRQENYIKYGQNGRKYVEEHHDITNIIEQYKNFFLEIQ